jgi:hypothetical protein
MSFSQTSGQPLENGPVICPEPSKDWGVKTVPASALCAPAIVGQGQILHKLRCTLGKVIHRRGG